MLIIDPNLHNPTINGIQLIVHNRINPQLALSQDDIFSGDGILVEKFQDGTIKISANIDSQEISAGNKYVEIYEIDFMKSLPSVLYKFLNALLSSAEEQVFYAKDYTVSKNITEFKPSLIYTYDVNGSVVSIEE